MKEECANCDCVMKSMRTLKDRQLEQLGKNHAVVKFKKDSTIIHQGMFSTNVVFLREGLVKVHITGPYNEQIVRLIKAPTYLGLPTTFGNKINQYSVTAILDSEACFIDINLFRKVLEENNNFSAYIIQELSKSELESYHRCANRAQKQTRGNLADVFLDLSDNIFESDSFTLPISQSDIGNLVDASRESINRLLSEFINDNIIEMKGRKVKILNKKSLQLISSNG
ncbi:MAG: Crp/Fnr family transcriptional regulator [Dysgonamonadaceae bacterium]|jgi:CRP/FNR family transcriptional regulator|nr:Crp/Fnr family transcriptional regulator [Dysgonamonadaceae bacterium]MDD3355335.1 Crp/Fnr family transcriptional regulator [Dysgonamonadaceae bacterium]MDD3726725.1 Crp/Fnr family transcriptional regulator [Dysgonamonadaceae bacterium]MDD4245570.1 Crp/Fnr family transcriptional regulator [Dysgonamonadaceae bacterium]MDD4605269.1 Crp/Fnr family transcriptional regulator [Dysgonamonadaceae bacterium]